MRWLRDLAATAAIVLVALVISIVYGAVAAGGEPDPKAKAAAALALAQAQREREKLAGLVAAGHCFADYDLAKAAALKAGKPLVLWVGMTCDKFPKLREDLAEAIHCHVTAERYGSPDNRVVIEGADGRIWFVREAKIQADTGAKLKAKWQAPPAKVPPAVPVEVSYVVPAPVRYGYGAAPPTYFAAGDCAPGGA